MREPTDDCLLCTTNKATKTNLHIIPKFIGKTILSDGDKKGYILDLKKTNNKVEKVQDSIKENYILCPSCDSSMA